MELTPGRRACLLVALLVGGAQIAQAEPYLAQREGYKCSKCHTNRTGGGKRTAFGFQYGLTHLDAFAKAPATTRPAPARPWMPDPNLGDWVSVGANLRLAHTTLFADEIHNTFQNPEADIYLEIKAGRLVTLYTDTSVAEGSVEAREAFGMLAFDFGLSIKAGVILLPYGLRIWGDDEFIRQVTGFGFDSPDLGVEIGVERGVFGAYLAASNGAGAGLDSDDHKRLSLHTELTFAPFRVALSGTYNATDDRSAFGGAVTLGASLGRVTLLTEFDVLATHYDKQDETVYSLVAYAELDVLIIRGLNLRVSYGFHDPAMDVEEDQRMSIRAGFEHYPVPFAAMGLFYTFRDSVPQDEVGNADSLHAELHLFF